MLLNRLGVLTDEVSANFVEALDWIKEQGLQHVEVRVVDGLNVVQLDDRQIERVRSEVEKRNLFVSCIASPVFKCALNTERLVASGDRFGQQEEDVAAHFLKLNRAMEIARKLKTDRIRIFSFWREQDPSRHEAEIVSLLKEAAQLASERQVQLLLENEPSCNGGYADEVARYVEQVNLPALKVLWDPGNEQYGGRAAFPAGYQRVKGLIGHIHLKDAYVSTEGNPCCVPIGSGAVPYQEHLQALLADGYAGLFTIETHFIPAGGTAMDGTRLSLQGLKALWLSKGMNEGADV